VGQRDVARHLEADGTLKKGRAAQLITYYTARTALMRSGWWDEASCGQL
jgi:hypothetical protein